MTLGRLHIHHTRIPVQYDFRAKSTMKTEQHYNPTQKGTCRKKKQKRRATTGDLAQFIIHLS